MNTALRLDDLPLDMATRCRLIVAACEVMEGRPKSRASFGEVAAELSAHLAGLQNSAAARPVSAGTLERYLKRWKDGGRRWQAVVDGRTVSANAKSALTAQPQFIAHLALLASRHKRALRGAVLELYAAWRAGEAIPGYEGMNYEPNMPLPKGWSEDNLLRRMPNKQALTITRQGVRAAADMLPQVFGTRAGAWPCSHVMFDDVWLDCLALGYTAKGEVQINRPLQLGCLDMYTGKRLSWGTKLRTKGEDGKSLQLNGDEMLFLLCDYLYTVGYSPRGTALVVEHGTAAISKVVEDMLALLTNGLVRVERSGMTGAKQAGAFGGRAVGNPRFKAHLESWHNLLHNRMDNELAQTGKDRNPPEALHGIQKESEALIKAGESLPPERALALMPYVPTLAELAGKLVQVVGGINARTDHNLEGWQACGFMVPEVSMTGREPWTPLHAIPAETRENVQAMITAHPSLMRLRPMSPQEAWEHSLRQPENRLIRFTPQECVQLMGAHRKFRLHAKGGAFKLDSKARHHEKLRFETTVKVQGNLRRELPVGGTYFGVFNPFSQSLFVLDEKDKVLGEAPFMEAVPYAADEESKLRVFGRVMSRRSEQLAIAENIVARDRAELEAQRAYNADVMAGRPFEPLGISDASTLANAPKSRSKTPLITILPESLPLPEDDAGSTFGSFNPFNN